jgi:sensor c-di-GMP phosphodiesterase-like protein
MNQESRPRGLAGRLVIITLATLGLVVGCLLGCAAAFFEADNSLEHSAEAAAARENAALAEARDVLHQMQDSRSGFCSESEVANFRLLVFRSEYMKDAGRIRGGRINCSAASGHPARISNQLGAPFKPDFRLKDGTLAYHGLTLLQTSSLSRWALRLGTAYVVFGVATPPEAEPFPIRLATAMQFPSAQEKDPMETRSGDPPNFTTAGNGETGKILYETRCSDPAFSCVTAASTISDALYGESTVISAFSLAGGIAGFFLGIGFPFQFGRNRDLGRQLRRALEQDKLEVRYQPIVSLETREIVGAEALARWTDEDGIPVDPEVFVKIAEEEGFIGLITKSVLKQVLRDFAATLRNRPGFRVSINVGAPDLIEPRFLPMLEGALEKAKVRPESLVVEITERSAANGEAAKETIRLLRRFGHSIHIDDFGSGFSNLDKLLYLYADTIKIDKAFTKTIDTESVAAVILPHIMTIAKSLNLEVIVEGVEITRQADYFLPGQQKIYGQGWLFGRPMTAEELLAQLNNHPLPVMLTEKGHAALQAGRRALHAATSLTS